MQADVSCKGSATAVSHPLPFKQWWGCRGVSASLTLTLEDCTAESSRSPIVEGNDIALASLPAISISSSEPAEVVGDEQDWVELTGAVLLY